MWFIVTFAFWVTALSSWQRTGPRVATCFIALWALAFLAGPLLLPAQAILTVAFLLTEKIRSALPPGL